MKQIFVSAPGFLGPVSFLATRHIPNTPRAKIVGGLPSGEEIFLADYPTPQMAEAALLQCSQVVMSPNIKDAFINFYPPEPTGPRSTAPSPWGSNLDKEPNLKPLTAGRNLVNKDIQEDPFAGLPLPDPPVASVPEPKLNKTITEEDRAQVAKTLYKQEVEYMRALGLGDIDQKSTGFKSAPGPLTTSDDVSLINKGANNSGDACNGNTSTIS